MRTARNGIGLVALALGMVACVDATQPTATGPAPYEGANVSMTGTTIVSIPTLDGRVVSATTREWAVDGVVTNGIAEAARSPVITDPNGPKMPVLYISDDNPLAQGRANHRQLVSGKDLKGNAHDFVFVNADAGPAKTIVHVGANRQVLEAYSFEWKKVNGGWRAMAFTATVFKDGKVLAQIRSANKLAPTKLAPTRASMLFVAMEDNCMYNALMPCGNGTPVFETLTNPIGGVPAGCNCSTELTDYLLAASAAATVIQGLVDSVMILTPWGAIAAGVAAATAGVYLYRYNQCVQACRALADSGGGTTGAFFGSVDPFDSKYFRRGLT